MKTETEIGRSYRNSFSDLENPKRKKGGFVLSYPILLTILKKVEILTTLTYLQYDSIGIK